MNVREWECELCGRKETTYGDDGVAGIWCVNGHEAARRWKLVRKNGRRIPTPAVRAKGDDLRITYPNPTACAVREFTADGVSVGRCYFQVVDGKCPRHGDVRRVQKVYANTGKLTDETALPVRASR